MGRTNYAAMSLIAAVPGAVLVILLVVGFLKHADGMPGLLPAVAGLTLLVAALLAVTPVGILVFSGQKTGGAGKPVKAAAVAEASADGSVAELESNDSLEVDEEFSDEFESADDAGSDWGDSEEFESALSDDGSDSEAAISESKVADAESDEFEFDDNLSDEFDADIDFDDDKKR